ncbi:hypothetical protein [Streptomyces sp. NPDC048192]|uniref:hypothetical protein n=1 Tax=Streptomyces sp. NPDC048192 TaxID=3365510 RepID=UPI00371ADB94
MTPIPDEAPGEPVPRHGRHRKPRPRKILLAAGGLALAAGVLSLVRVAPESGVGAPGTAEAEPRATDHAANTTATLSAAPTALPSATSVMGGSGPTPLATGSPATTPHPTAPTTAPGAGTAPTGAPTRRTPPRETTPQPTTSAPRPAPTPTTHPAPTTPAPSHSAPPQGPGGVCVPVLGLCVNLGG